MNLAIFILLFLIGFLYAALDASIKKHKNWAILWIAPTLSFSYAREHGLWLSVLLQIIGITGIAIIFIIKSL